MIYSSLTDRAALTDQYGNYLAFPQLGQITDIGITTGTDTNTWSVQGLQTATINWGYVGSGYYQRQRLANKYYSKEYLLFTNGLYQPIWQPSGKKFRVMGVAIAAGAAATFNILDGITTAYGPILVYRASGPNTVYVDFGNGYLSSTAGYSLAIYNNGPQAPMNVTAWGVEE